MKTMHQTHQDEPGDEIDDEAADAAAAAAAADQGAPDAASPFRKGVELAGNAVDLDEVAPLQPTPAAGTTAATDEGVDDEGNPIVPAGEQPAPATPEEEAEAEQAAAEKKYQEDLAKDVAALEAEGAKPKTIERFKTLTARVRELETASAELPALRDQAKAAVDWEETVTSTGAAPEQFANVLGYLHTINKGSREDQLKALGALDKERAWLAQKLGIKSEGYDPLDEHEDLKAKVQKGEIDESDALEIVESRRLKAEREQGEQQKTMEQRQEMAIGEIAEMGKALRGKDPLFKEKLAYLKPTIAVIQKTLPPEQWKGEIEAAYKALPKVQPEVKPKPRVTAPATRPTGGGNMKPEVTSGNAFSMGVQAAKNAGR